MTTYFDICLLAPTYLPYNLLSITLLSSYFPFTFILLALVLILLALVLILLAHVLILLALVLILLAPYFPLTFPLLSTY
jgi:hypothetical protein